MFEILQIAEPFLPTDLLEVFPEILNTKDIFILIFFKGGTISCRCHVLLHMVDIHVIHPGHVRRVCSIGNVDNRIHIETRDQGSVRGNADLIRINDLFCCDDQALCRF